MYGIAAKLAIPTRGTCWRLFTCLLGTLRRILRQIGIAYGSCSTESRQLFKKFTKSWYPGDQMQNLTLKDILTKGPYLRQGNPL